jgi:hypothetical protein
MKAYAICEMARALLKDDREQQHGDKKRNHDNIAALWNAYLKIRRDPAAPLDAGDCATMMALLKIARMELGGYNEDDAIDACGYLAIRGELDDTKYRTRRDVIPPVKMRGQV